MKRTLLISCALLCGACLAYSQQQELEVVRIMMMRIQRAPWNRHVMSCSTNEASTYYRVDPAYVGLFTKYPTNHFGAAWTPQERQAAFERFISDIPVLSTNGMYRTLVPDGEISLNYCVEHSHSNVLDAALNILRSPHAKCHATAVGVFGSFARPSAEINSFVEEVLAGTDPKMDVVRNEVLRNYARILRTRRTGCLAEDVTNGVALVTHAVTRVMYGAILVDQLLLDMYPQYAVSSNRLSLADFALSNMQQPSYLIPNTHSYFDPITNQLRQAAQPLPEVEGL